MESNCYTNLMGSRIKFGMTVLVSLVTCYLLLVTSAHAVTPTTTQSPTPSKTPAKNAVDDQINQLKDRIASRVAQLKLVERRGIIGTVTDVSQTQLTIHDVQRNTRFIDVDELTKFSSPSAKGTFGISDIAKGSSLGVLGLYNKQSRRTLARFVDVLYLPVTQRGAISLVDPEEFVIQIITQEGKIIPVEVENITRTTSYDNTGTATKSGFSKLSIGQRIVVVGFTDRTDQTRIIASRILLFPNLPINPKIPFTITHQAEAPISTGSGKKLTPLTR